jgi:putative ABC transport system ATP-binding protein
MTAVYSTEAGALIHLEHIVKTYNPGQENELEVLHGISLNIREGEFTAIVGESGSGKSTLMNIIGVLDQPTSGRYVLDGQNICSAARDQMSDIRCRKIGFVFQNFNLIGRASALENVELPMLYAGVPAGRRRARARQLLRMVGMGERMDHVPSQLSGGQKQRVAIARSLANDPALLLADEPTGALDSATSRTVMDIFHHLHAQGRTIVFITHNRELAAECPRVLTLIDGRIVQDERGKEKC